MEKELLRFKKLRDIVIGVEMQLVIIEKDLLAVDKDLVFLSDLEHVLIENINILRSPNIIAVASEYRRSCLEIKKVRENLAFYSNLKSKLERDLVKNEKARVSYMEEYLSMKKILESRRVIILFDPSRKRNT